MTNVVKMYMYQAGKLLMHDGTRYDDILFVETSFSEFTFVDVEGGIHKIDPRQIEKFDFRKMHDDQIEENGRYLLDDSEDSYA